MDKRFLFFFLLLLIPLGIRAEEININNKGSINITYKYGNTSVSNADIYIYKVANINNTGKFTYLENYRLDDNLDNVSASKWNDLAITINKYIKDNNIEKTNSCKTDSNGICKINNLDLGLYLLITNEITVGKYKYTTSPSLISLPNYNESDHNLMYDIDMLLKTEAKLINISDEKTEKKSSTSDVSNTVPKTIDMIYTYGILLLVSIIAIVLVVLYIKKIRKKEINNEKNN